VFTAVLPAPARLRALFVVVVLMLAIAACSPDGAGSPTAAATVNDEEIPVSAVEERFEAVEANPQFSEQLAADEEGDLRSEVESEILTGLIRTRLLEQGADELGVEVGDDDVEAQRAEIVDEVGGEEAFDQLVEQQGLSEDEVDNQIRELALQEALTDELVAELEVSDEELEAFYEENYGTASARHILLETEDEAEDVLDELDDGADFGELAEERSTDPSAAENQGDLGEFERGDMVEEFSAAVFDAEEGEIVGPVESDFGFHVIEVQELDEGPPLDEVEDDIRAQLLEADRAGAIQSYLEERTGEATVSVNPRFGEWDDEQGRVVPSDPLGDVETDEGPEDPGMVPEDELEPEVEPEPDADAEVDPDS
jgi:peptidyl-prolyl cis-trans isomerase C